MLLAKDLIRGKQAKNEQLENNINDWLINLGNNIIKKESPENENPKKIVDNSYILFIEKKNLPKKYIAI